MYKSIDLFAGIGGIRKGFDRAFGEEINTVFVSEWDEFAQKTYRMNYKDDFDIAGDITKIDEKIIEKYLKENQLENQKEHKGKYQINLTDTECNFINVAEKLLGQKITINKIEL